jgi:hypothetical protein
MVGRYIKGSCARVRVLYLISWLGDSCQSNFQRRIIVLLHFGIGARFLISRGRWYLLRQKTFHSFGPQIPSKHQHCHHHSHHHTTYKRKYSQDPPNGHAVPLPNIIVHITIATTPITHKRPPHNKLVAFSTSKFYHSPPLTITRQHFECIRLLLPHLYPLLQVLSYS